MKREDEERRRVERERKAEEERLIKEQQRRRRLEEQARRDEAAAEWAARPETDEPRFQVNDHFNFRDFDLDDALDASDDGEEDGDVDLGTTAGSRSDLEEYLYGIQSRIRSFDDGLQNGIVRIHPPDPSIALATDIKLGRFPSPKFFLYPEVYIFDPVSSYSHIGVKCPNPACLHKHSQVCILVLFQDIY